MNDFEGKHVVVTGGTGAIGSAVVEALLERGATCHVPSRSQASVDRYALKDHERVHPVPDVNLSDEESVARFYEGLPTLWGSAHIAGGFTMAPLAETSLSVFERMFQTNAVSCFLCCKHAVASMRAGGAGGRVVNVSARNVLVPSAGAVAYSASKAAVASITQTLGPELAPESIFVNAIVPSVMNTATNREAMPDADHSRWPTVQEAAAAVAYLLSPANNASHGAMVPVYGRA